MPTFRSNTSANTTMTVNLVQTARGNGTVTYRVDWSAYLGSATGLGTGHPRTLYIYNNSTGAVLASSLIKASSATWNAYGTYSGSFSFSMSVGNAAGSISTYIRTDTSSIGSCTWTNASYCTAWSTAYSLYYSAAKAPSAPTISPSIYNNTLSFGWTGGSAGVNNSITAQYIQIYRNGALYNAVNVGTSARSYTLDTSGFASAATVYFRVYITTQYSGTLYSGNSATVKKNSAPYTPTSPTVPKTTYLPGETIRVSFSNNGDPDSNHTGFQVARDDSATIVGTNASKTATYVDVNTTGWAQGSQYRLRVRSYDAFGYMSGWSTYTATITLNTAPLTPGIYYPVAGATVYNKGPRILLKAAATNDGPYHVYDFYDTAWKSTANSGALFSCGTTSNLASGRQLVFKPNVDYPAGSQTYKGRMYDGYLYSSEVSRSFNISEIAFTDPVLVAKETKVKAVHITELQVAVNNLLEAYGFARKSFTPVVTGVTKISNSTIITELQGALKDIIARINSWDSATSTFDISVTWVNPIVSNGVNASLLRQAIEQMRMLVQTI